MNRAPDCQCEKCQKSCDYKPGWFLPGEAEKVAEFLGMPLLELFQTKLAVDWWVEFPEDIFTLSPAITTSGPGQEFPSNPRGRCVFFNNSLCDIHKVKPFECYASHCSFDNGKLHEQAADAWREHQEQIKELLGHEPVSESMNLFDLLWN